MMTHGDLRRPPRTLGAGRPVWMRPLHTGDRPAISTPEIHRRRTAPRGRRPERGYEEGRSGGSSAAKRREAYLTILLVRDGNVGPERRRALKTSGAGDPSGR